MADVKVVIKQLKKIVKANYKKVHDDKPPSSRKTGHQVAFEALQGSASQVVAILIQNPEPNSDQQENVTAQFSSMKKNVKIYCPKTAETDDVLRAFHKASTEWDELVEEL